MENSKILLQYAIGALKQTNIKDGEWAIGGGTVLASYYNHRMSKDIDVFINEAQYLSEISPRFNDACEDVLDYDEMSNYISLSFIEGKVDFIVAAHLTKFPATLQSFFGQIVMLDDVVEIVAKKLYFRNDHILPRDLFDLAIVYNSNRRSDLVDFALGVPEKIKIFIETFENNKELLKYKAYSLVYWESILEGGRSIVGKEIDICQQFVDEIKAKIY